MGPHGVHSEIPPNEKIRFRRSDIAGLDRFPSALPPVRRPVWISAPHHLLKVLAGAAAALVAVAALLVAATASGIGDERLRVEAQAALAALAGEGFAPRIGEARVAFDGAGILALEVRDARIASAATQAEITHIGSARFGLRLLPLAFGKVEIDRIRLGGVRVDLAALPRSQTALPLPFLNDDGLVDADVLAAEIFAGAERLVDSFHARGVDAIDLGDVEVVLPGNGESGSLRVVDAGIRRGSGGVLSLSANLEGFGRAARLEGSIAPDARGAHVEALSLRLDAPLRDGEADGHFGSVEFALDGARRAGGPLFSLSGRVENARLPLGREGLRADIDIETTAEHGSGKMEIDRLRVRSGRSTWNFHGAIGQMPAPAGSEPAYRFELVSDGSTIAPADSPEPALPIVARVAGRFDAGARRIEVEEIGARSGRGEVRGDALVQLVPGSAPGIALRLEVERMPVGHAKQLWPVFAAPPARKWVVANVFGGQVERGGIGFEVPPGRLGNGVPLGADEVWGTFTIRDTRFDVVGRIPPVRDADGVVDFRGTNVDISVSSGSAFSPSGRMVSAAGGTLTIRDAHVRPVIGRLRIDKVEGTADAVFELASYDPINVGRFVDLTPGDFSGTVSGSVSTDIPFTRDIPVESLDWRVDLAYEDVALARPFEGQTVTQAAGTIVVDPQRAVIDAKGLLNGAEATVHLVEPLGSDKTGRQRRIALQTDDRVRQALAPGIDTVLAGPAEVELDDAARERRAVRVGLDRATLTIPWMGWSKGGGVPATAAFDVLTQDGRTEISGFRLDGETFGATGGALSLVDGTVERARFPSARLNRGDDFSVDVQARGQGYAVTIRGESLDVRSAVKLYMKDAQGGGPPGRGTPVTVDLEVASATGFHGETLRDVKLVYSGTGARTERLEFSATTASGRQVTFSDAREGDARDVAMHTGDAGAVLRFLDIYEHMQAGAMELALSGQGNGPLSGRVDARDFRVVNEPRLSSIASTPPQGDDRSLNQAVRAEIDTSRVHFERGYSRIVKEPGALTLSRGVLRGPQIGMSFQGTLYDRDGNMALTGTFMPAYGLNRLFGEIPIIGQILGNRRDRGLIGITFRLAGKVGEPQLQVNPLSIIAPGIFRSVFEFQ